MIPRLGDGNFFGLGLLNESLENDSPSRGRKRTLPLNPVKTSMKHSLENDSPSRGRKR